MSIRRIFAICLTLLLLYCIGIFCIYILIDFIVFNPVKHSKSYKYSFEYKFNEFTLTQPNNEKLNVVEFNSDLAPKATILFLHGATKSVDYWSKNFAGFFLERNCNVVIPDYRGYGKSEGNSTEFNWNEDAQLVYSWLKTKVNQDSIIIVGYGLGAVTAAYLGTLSPCRLLIMINPIYGIRSWLRAHLPAIFLLPRDPKYDFNCYEYIPNIISPSVLMLNKNTKDMSEESVNHLKRLLNDSNTFFELDHPPKDLPVNDTKFSDAFDLLINNL